MRSNPLDNLDDLLEQLEDGLDVPTAHGVSVDLLEDDDAYQLKVDLPGYSTEEIDVTYADNQVTVAAERSESATTGDRTYLRQERRHRSVSRTVSIPGRIEEEQVTAEYSNGVLTVLLPKSDHDVDGREIEIE